MKFSRLMIAGTVMFMLCLLWQLPSSLLEPLVLQASQGRLRLAASTGRVWQGHASLFFRPAPAEPWQAAGEVRWRITWLDARNHWPLPALDLQQHDGRMRLVPARDGLHVHVENWRLPLAALLPHQSLLPAGGWRGTLVLAQSRIVYPWQGGPWQGQGTLYWREARTVLLESRWLGHYRLDWQQQQGLSGQISTLEGDLQLQGQLAGPAGGPLQFSGTARAGGPHRALLEAPLRLLGEAASQDAYRIRWPRS